MKIQKIFTIDAELVQKLKEEENGSGLINQLIQDYYDRTDGVLKIDDSDSIIEEVKRKMKAEEKEIKEEEEKEKYFQFMNDNRAEFNDGYKKGSWKNYKEFYDAKQEIHKGETKGI